MTQADSEARRYKALEYALGETVIGEKPEATVARAAAYEAYLKDGSPGRWVIPTEPEPAAERLDRSVQVPLKRTTLVDPGLCGFEVGKSICTLTAGHGGLHEQNRDMDSDRGRDSG